MLTYTVKLVPRSKSGNEKEWTGEAVCLLDALQQARQSVWPVLHTAMVVSSE